MSIEEKLVMCGGKGNYHRLYSLCEDSISNFLDSAKLDHSEKSFNIMKTIFDDVLEDIRESWYRRSLDDILSRLKT